MTEPITEKLVRALLPRRKPDSQKGDYGRVLCLCGCSRYRGAAALCTLGALRAGAGLVTLAAAEPVLAAVAPQAPEAILLPLPDPAGLEAALQKSTACAAGCGKEETAETAREMAFALDLAAGTLVLDAGGLCSLAGQKERLSAAAGRLIVTPHFGEMAKLAGVDVSRVKARPAETALAFAAETGAVTVLKCHRTLVAAPDGRLYRNTTGNPGLSRGGSGDLLAGMVAGLAAQGLSPLDAALCGVYLHGRAADDCAARLSMQGMLPSDILADLCAVFLALGR